MADTTRKKSNFISDSIAAGVAILENVDELRALLREATVLNYGVVLTDEDFTGANAHVTKAQLVDLFTTINALTALLDANNNAHYANLYDLKP